MSKENHGKFNVNEKEMDDFLAGLDESGFYQKHGINPTSLDCAHIAIAMSKIVPVNGYLCGEVDNEFYHCGFIVDGNLFDGKGKTNEENLLDDSPGNREETTINFVDTNDTPHSEPKFFDLVEDDGGKRVQFIKELMEKELEKFT